MASTPRCDLSWPVSNRLSLFKNATVSGTASRQKRSVEKHLHESTNTSHWSLLSFESRCLIHAFVAMRKQKHFPALMLPRVAGSHVQRICNFLRTEKGRGVTGKLVEGSTTLCRAVKLSLRITRSCLEALRALVSSRRVASGPSISNAWAVL